MSQHDSFNESDFLFAAMDMQNLPDLPQAHTENKPAAAEYSKSSIQLPKSWISQTDIFASDNRTSNRTVFDSAATMNPTCQTLQKFKTLSQVMSDHNFSPPDPAKHDSNVPVVTSRSLKDKFRKAMQQNAKVNKKRIPCLQKSWNLERKEEVMAF